MIAKLLDRLLNIRMINIARISFPREKDKGKQKTKETNLLGDVLFKRRLVREDTRKKKEKSEPKEKRRKTDEDERKLNTRNICKNAQLLPNESFRHS